MDYPTQSCRELTELLASKAPVPGGGSASALVGAVGISLGNMVGNLTLGKKKYAEVQQDMLRLNEQAGQLRQFLLEGMNRDAWAFEPLSRAYGLPAETAGEKAHKDEVMGRALSQAAAAPLEIMEQCAQSIELLQEYAAKGTALAISDAGVGAAFCRAALEGALLNVLINTKAMSDRIEAEALNRRALKLYDRYIPAAQRIYDDVRGRLQ